MLSNYIDLFFVQRIRGQSYIPTLCLQAVAVVLLLNDWPRTGKGWIRKIAECVLFCLLANALLALYVQLFGADAVMATVTIALTTLLYALFRSKYSAGTRIVRGTMQLACVVVTVPLSTPISELIRDTNIEMFFKWGQHITLLLIFLLTLVVVLYIRHFSFDEGSPIKFQYVLLQAGISLVTVGIETVSIYQAVPTLVNVLTCAGLWGMNLLSYYLFFTIARGTQENLILRSTKHRMELEKEKYETNCVNYDELRAMRHELKNYTFYIQALLDAKKYEELKEFLADSLASKSPVLNSYDCGNYMVDVIMNHEINAAREQGVRVKPDILVPHELPFCDEDLCSLLTNIMDNAIEAAVASKREPPQISLTIRPKQEYLFIHQENPVSADIPSDQRLSLRTTKKNGELHGYGTRIIRGIVDKYNGSIKYAMRDGLFITDVMLELKEKKSA
jgi:hypothetical protein